ncbi:hypothetical protein [Cupriavidus taiwanensis]|nr:hypothetical protein [Cupriavidus taiwanensis]
MWCKPHGGFFMIPPHGRPSEENRFKNNGVMRQGITYRSDRNVFP